MGVQSRCQNSCQNLCRNHGYVDGQTDCLSACEATCEDTITSPWLARHSHSGNIYITCLLAVNILTVVGVIIYNLAVRWRRARASKAARNNDRVLSVDKQKAFSKRIETADKYIFRLASFNQFNAMIVWFIDCYHLINAPDNSDSSSASDINAGIDSAFRSCLKFLENFVVYAACAILGIAIAIVIYIIIPKLQRRLVASFLLGFTKREARKPMNHYLPLARNLCCSVFLFWNLTFLLIVWYWSPNSSYSISRNLVSGVAISSGLLSMDAAIHLIWRTDKLAETKVNLCPGASVEEIVAIFGETVKTDQYDWNEKKSLLPE